MKTVKIENKIIGEKDSCLIIAEAGVNHGGHLKRAKELIKKAADSGADAIKFQTYKAEKLVTKKAPRFWDWNGEEKPEGTQYDSYSRDEHQLNKDLYPKIIEYCKENDIIFMSTPFDEDSADFLDELGMKSYKIASCDLTNLPFLKHIAKKQKPLLLSTGASNISEIKEALNIIYSTGNKDVVLMHCTLCYPTKNGDVNLRMMQQMIKEFSDVPVGISDHSLGVIVPLAAVALGAKVIEKHFTIDKTLLKSADHWLSIDPAELKQITKNKNIILKAMGSPVKEKIACENLTFKYARRSIVSEKKIPIGTTITSEMIAVKRPGTGIAPKHFKEIIGKTTAKNIEEDSLISWDDLV